ncbi:hypothetical protein EZS27_029960 [termite gut metagenome]|uniref:Uncharacterized protein n=1 Tax=termite gut metagenome TaxID=433724 RepID=A0A5J4QFH1_9ZZZZ
MSCHMKGKVLRYPTCLGNFFELEVTLPVGGGLEQSSSFMRVATVLVHDLKGYSQQLHSEWCLSLLPFGNNPFRTVRKGLDTFQGQVPDVYVGYSSEACENENISYKGKHTI